jgi:hypothetical protein
MRTYKMLLVAALIAAISVLFTGNYGKALAAESDDLTNLRQMIETPGDINNPDIYNPAVPEASNRTCQGNLVGTDTRTYVFGLNRMDGYCSTGIIKANGTNEAWTCARALCATCRVEDITDRYDASMFTSPLGPVRQYCPAK